MPTESSLPPSAPAPSAPPAARHYTAFDGHRRLAGGALHEVALAVKHAAEAAAAVPTPTPLADARPILIFDDLTGRAIEIDTRGQDAAVVARFQPRPFPASSDQDESAEAADSPRGRGRPRLGVTAREVTLLPRHWEWLNGQPGGASVALRKLVEDARRANSQADRQRQRRDAAYHFMSSIAGNFPGFEEASRALFANDAPRFERQIAAWPEDVRAHVVKLAFADGAESARDDSRAAGAS